MQALEKREQQALELAEKNLLSLNANVDNDIQLLFEKLQYT